MSRETEHTEGLARKAMANDSVAFEELFRRIRGRLEMWISLRMGPLLRSRLSVDDVLQETLLQAHRSLPGFTARGPGSFRRWIISVAENRLKDLHRYHAAQRRDPAREAYIAPQTEDESGMLQRLEDAGESPASEADRRALVNRLVDGIQRLPHELKEVVILRSIEERTYKEIAEHMDQRPAAIQGLYTRALKKLQDELGA